MPRFGDPIDEVVGLYSIDLNLIKNLKFDRRVYDLRVGKSLREPELERLLKMQFSTNPSFSLTE